MTTPTTDSTPDLVSKVTFSPVSDSTGNQALVVTIKSVTPQAEDIPKITEKTRRSLSFESKRTPSEAKRKARSRTLVNTRSTMNKSTMTEQPQERSLETQTSVTDPGETLSTSFKSVPVLEATSSSNFKPVSETSSNLSSDIPSVYASSDPKAASSTSFESAPVLEATSSSNFQPISKMASNLSSDTPSVSGATSSLSVKSVTIPEKAFSPDCQPVPKTSNFSDNTPCLKHAAENISRKATDIETEKVSLCSNCSKSMLSYIFVVQDFLDSLAKEICGNSDSQNCVQCLRQETRLSMSARDDDGKSGSVTHSDNRKSSKSRARDDRGSSKYDEARRSSNQTSSTRSKEPRRDVGRYEESSGQIIESSLVKNRQLHHQDQHGYSSQGKVHDMQGKEVIVGKQTSQTYNNVGEQQAEARTSLQGQERGHQESHLGQEAKHQDQQATHQDQQAAREGREVAHQGPQDAYQYQPATQSHPAQHGQQANPVSDKDDLQTHPGQHGDQSYRDGSSHPEHIPLRVPVGRQRPGFAAYQNEEVESTPFSEGVDGIVSTLSNAEREVYDAARNRAGWEGLSEAQVSSPVPSEAYVTMCRNNAEALGCLVVGTSLLLSRTSRTLCVFVSDRVSNAFRGPLSSVFHVVQCARSMDSLGTTKLALLEQPEIGVSFEKLNVWRLIQFTKCVFLNPDTLVVQNCDELFCRDELSAVADIGWPDCFNSGVFVFVPSLHTFWQLAEFAERHGSYDGGDQGLLNSYFNSWSEDINKKLSFIYNLMANVSYTYTPAFKQFGRNVKVVQFHGSFKPWHVKFFGRTGQISQESPVHPTYVQFVHIWINIFRISALGQLPQEIKSYAQSQEVICAVELLRFFPLPTESETEFFLTPPSVRLRLTERKLLIIPPREYNSEIQRRKSAEFPRHSLADDIENESADGNPTSNKVIANADSDRIAKDSPNVIGDAAFSESTNVLEASESANVVGDAVDGGPQESSETLAKPRLDENALPGSEVGNYQGMKAWEQGRMDYQGSDSSDAVIKRLQFLMTHPK